jgi:LPS export ABC transporter permease LptG/LPS export ABC transporter permease LptF
MPKILDRYLVREILPPTLLSLVVVTFLLEVPTIIQQGESLIEKGVPWSVVGRVLVALLPSALALSIPIALIFGILIGLGRLSADREFVALQACGVSLFRLVLPIAVLALLATLATGYEMIVALPDGNQTFREITFGVVSTHAEQDVKPRVFYQEFPNRTLYVRDLPPEGGWRDVFLADTSTPGETTVYLAREGHLIVDPDQRTVVVELRDGTSHRTEAAHPELHDDNAFTQLFVNLDADAVFPRAISKGIPEKTIAELEADIQVKRGQNQPVAFEQFMIQQKFSFPAACLVLALLGLALGFNNRKDGKLASFALGFIVVFLYYVLLWSMRALAMAGRFPAPLAPWVPNVFLGVVGVFLAIRRSRAADEPVRITLPAVLRRAATREPGTPGARPARSKVILVVRVPRLNLPRPTLLDLYVARQYLGVFLLGIGCFLGIFYIATFIDVADELFSGSATFGAILRYFYFATPQFVYYVIPMGALIAALVTIGLMTKNSELVVMKACGISLYRASMPLMIFALVSSAALVGLQERVMATSNREADRLNRQIRGLPPLPSGLLGRHWVVGGSGELYHFAAFSQPENRFTDFVAFQLDEADWHLERVTRASEVLRPAAAGTDAANPATRIPWVWRQGWERQFAPSGLAVVRYQTFETRALPLEPPSYFQSEEPDADRMSYRELQQYIRQLQAGGFNVVPNQVALQRKVAFPFVTVIMTMLAIPFAVTTGRRGALYGVGVGIAIAIVYWTLLSVFVAVGSAGKLAPLLAAWAPNVLFGAVGGYLILTVRT